MGAAVLVQGQGGQQELQVLWAGAARAEEMELQTVMSGQERASVCAWK